MKTLKTVSSIGIVTLSIGLGACQKQDTAVTNTSEKQAAAPVKTLSFGYQKSSLNLLVAREQKLFEQQFPQAKIEWKEFPAGPQMLEALSVGAVDFGAVGNTPPIFAQAADKELSYVGYEQVPANAQALLIAKNSSIDSIQSLKGKRIAVQRGSSAHELLAKVLQKAGLSWQDIQPIWLPPADARAAFDKQSIDAWAIWEPYLSAAEQDAQARVLIDGTAFPKTYSFYIGNPKFIQAYPEANAQFIHGLNQADQWVLKNQTQALSVYTQSTGLQPSIAQRVIDKRLKPSPIQTLTPGVVQAQQQIADLFLQVQLIPKHIQVQSTVWVAPSKP